MGTSTLNSWKTKFDRTIDELINGISLDYKSDQSLMSNEVLDIINNPSDKKKS